MKLNYRLIYKIIIFTEILLIFTDYLKSYQTSFFLENKKIMIYNKSIRILKIKNHLVFQIIFFKVNLNKLYIFF
jgi:hypothetical protein